MTIILHNGNCGQVNCRDCKEYVDREARRFQVELWNPKTEKWEMMRKDATYRELVESSVADRMIRMQINDVYASADIIVTRVK